MSFCTIFSPRMMAVFFSSAPPILRKVRTRWHGSRGHGLLSSMLAVQLNGHLWVTVSYWRKAANRTYPITRRPVGFAELVINRPRTFKDVLSGNVIATKSEEIHRYIRSFGKIYADARSVQARETNLDGWEIISTPSKQPDRKLRIPRIHSEHPLIGSEVVLRMSSKNVLVESTQNGNITATKNWQNKETDPVAFEVATTPAHKYPRGFIQLRSKASEKRLIVSGSERVEATGEKSSAIAHHVLSDHYQRGLHQTFTAWAQWLSSRYGEWSLHWRLTEERRL
ncbi:hypothetical protein NDN08_000124 [Rhodosorus marinus]|uniref:Uncharacterized protein n=1 Tax=Rhodosorus marinus TaxID=101924 RepID=A0AAV8UEA5_9RHOD|nr:hypothetical protein NDN08_000124 [Rhodosorus marinus]